MRRQGFTLIELLVVVAIIVALLAILMPSLNKARNVARRAQCMSNLHQWGIGLLAYGVSNRMTFMSSARPHGNNVHPMIVFGRHDAPIAVNGGVAPTGQFAANLIDPFIGGTLDFNQYVVPNNSLWLCPASLANGMNSQALINDPPTKIWEVYGVFHFGYQYLARPELWAAGQATHPKDLVSHGMPGPQQTLMTDELWFQKGSLAWQYGHGNPPSGHASYMGMGMLPTPNSLEGINKLWGDGSVRWKPASEFDLNSMGALPGVGTPENHWANAAQAATAY